MYLLHGTVHQVLKPGMKCLNWNLLGIHDFIVKCEQVRELSIRISCTILVVKVVRTICMYNTLSESMN